MIPDMVVLEPDPAIPPGFIVQFPVGRPLNSALPVASAQLGCVIAPARGADGVTGCALITTSADADEIHPAEFLTVKA